MLFSNYKRDTRVQLEVQVVDIERVLQSVSILQKRAIRIIHNAGYKDHTNSLFFKNFKIY